MNNQTPVISKYFESLFKELKKIKTENQYYYFLGLLTMARMTAAIYSEEYVLLFNKAELISKNFKNPKSRKDDKK